MLLWVVDWPDPSSAGRIGADELRPVGRVAAVVIKTVPSLWVRRRAVTMLGSQLFKVVSRVLRDLGKLE